MQLSCNAVLQQIFPERIKSMVDSMDCNFKILELSKNFLNAF